MNISELRDKLNLIINDVDYDPSAAKVLVDIGGGERVEIREVNLMIRTPADEAKGYDEDEELWNFEDGSPVLGVHFDSVDDLRVVFDADWD